MTTTADQLAGEGVPILTRRGPMQLQYGFRALRALEDRFGSIVGMQDAMQAVLDTMGEDGRGKAFGPLADIVVPGLLHTGLSADELEDALLPGEVRTYVHAMQDAMQQAFPDVDGTAVASPGNAGSPAGPGPSGSTSPQAGTGAPQSSSGA